MKFISWFIEYLHFILVFQVTDGQNDLKTEEQNIICGALELHRKTVKEVMTPLDDVFMLDIGSFLNFNTINAIMQQGEFNTIVSTVMINTIFHFNFSPTATEVII